MPIVKTLQKHKIVLDTHVLIWHATGSNVLPKKFQAACEQLQEINPILISPISIWEVGMLSEKGKILLEMDCLQWVEQMLSCPYFELAPISPSIVVLSTRLPGEVHGDPADRLLIATAFEHHAVLVTCNEKILEYGQNHFVNVHDPRK